MTKTVAVVSAATAAESTKARSRSLKAGMFQELEQLFACALRCRLRRG